MNVRPGTADFNDDVLPTGARSTSEQNIIARLSHLCVRKRSNTISDSNTRTLYITTRSRILSLQAISIPAKTAHPQGLIVMLHGWGANAQDVAALASFLDLPEYQFFFPNAPFPFPYAPQGRAWYNFPQDYSFLTLPEFHQQPELQESRKQLVDWLHSLVDQTGVPLSQTILAGFSQGGAMTLDVGLQLPVAALMVLSGYVHATLEGTPPFPPVFMVHGRQDAVVPLRAAYQAQEALRSLGAVVEYHELDMGHEVQPIVLSQMQSFIEEQHLQPDKS